MIITSYYYIELLYLLLFDAHAHNNNYYYSITLIPSLVPTMSGSQGRDTTDDWSGFRPVPSHDLLTQYTDEAVQAAAKALRHLDRTEDSVGSDNDVMH